MKKFAVLLVASLLTACMSAPPAAPPPPPAPPAAAGAAQVGKGSKPGFCTFKDASGVLFEKKC